MDTKQSLAKVIFEAIDNCFPGADGLPQEADIAGMLEIPPEKEMGDYAFPCFKLSKALRKSPMMISDALAAAISAAIAEYSGTDASAIRILSIKKL